MKFWDTSAVLPLLVDEPTSTEVRQLLEVDAEMAVWWNTVVECTSGIARLRREGGLKIDEESATIATLEVLSRSWLEILPVEVVRVSARRLLRVHSLRAADALQLAAALEWRRHSDGADFVTFDERLGNAARLEGFTVPF